MNNDKTCDRCDMPAEFHIEQRSPRGDSGVYTGFYCRVHAFERVREDHTEATRGLLPCLYCGVDLLEVDAEETTGTVYHDYEFGGKQATTDVPAYKCPECGEVTVL